MRNVTDYIADRLANGPSWSDPDFSERPVTFNGPLELPFVVLLMQCSLQDPKASASDRSPYTEHLTRPWDLGQRGRLQRLPPLNTAGDPPGT